MQKPAGTESKLSDTGHMAFKGARMTKAELKPTLDSRRSKLTQRKTQIKDVQNKQEILQELREKEQK